MTVEDQTDGYRINVNKCKFDTPICHYPEEYDFPDKLYQAHWEKAYAWGIVKKDDNKQELLACIETCPEEWSNRLMITELWVHENLRRKGIGHALMAIAKEQAVLEHRRAVILETQSCNVGAISFYRKEGFEIIGLDTCCYSNRDIERKEVRINMGYFPRKKKLGKENILIRKETEKEYHQTEEVVLRAFWNKYRLGCNEHLLVHKLRDSEVYLPELSRVAVVDDEVAGVIIMGEPDYYPRHGFKNCDKYGITTADGKNFDAFMGIELIEGGLSDFGGRFYEPDVFEDLSEKETEQFTKEFDAPAKQKFPAQWD